jgi:hypothetical protein
MDNRIESGRSGKCLLRILAVVLILVVEVPFLFFIAGDAQVHLAVAESFVHGHPFQYNLGDPFVMASSSPFWTMVLIGLFHVFGDLTPLALKAVSLLCWAGASYLLWKVVTEVWQWVRWKCVVILLIWLTNTAVVANALGGLENVLTALQLLLIYLICARTTDNFSWQRSLGLGLLLGWAILTRVDSGFFACICVCLFFLGKFLSARAQRKTIVAQFVFVALLSGLVILPWYFYQHFVTGKLVSDSALARLYGGRRTSWAIVNDHLYFHPKALFSLVTVFMPLTLGALLTFYKWGRNLFRSRERFEAQLSVTYATFAAVTILGVGILFYTFVVGADHFGRYFIPIFPFFFILGFQGLWTLYEDLSEKRRWLAKCMLSSMVCYLLLGSGVDYYRRVVLRDQYSPDLLKVVADHRDRVGYTDRYLAELGVPTTNHVNVAMIEVQLRFYVDDRITILSLDGRTSAQLLKYIDRTSGVPDFRGYFEETRPDFVQFGNWCGEERGWAARFRLQRELSNLLCEWEQRASAMKIGDGFDWNGNRVVLVMPDTVRILWQLSPKASAS